MYLIILKCPMHIEITSVCGQDWEIEAFKSMTVKLEQKPCKLVWQNRENFIRAQSASISVSDFAMIKSIKSPMLAPAAHQRVHDVTTYLACNAIMSIMHIMHIIQISCIIRNMKISPLPAPKYSILSPYTALHHRQQCRTQFRCSRSDQEPTSRH